MSQETVQIGPFTGGMNTVSDPTAIGDAEAASLINLELEPSGALRVRPLIYPSTSLVTPSGAYGGLKILGYYDPLGGAVRRVIATNGTNTYILSADGGLWVQIHPLPASAIVQVRDRLYLLSSSAPVEPVYLTDFNNSTSQFATSTTQSAMPRGTSAVLLKDRIWIVNANASGAAASRVHVSDFDTGDPVIWNNDFITASSSDGQRILDITVAGQDLIIFKSGSTHRFSYGANPGDGAVSVVSLTIGVPATDCVAAGENSHYVFSGSSVYELANYQYSSLSDQKIDILNSRPPSPQVISAAAMTLHRAIDRLFLNYYGRTYVFFITTRTWSEWVCNQDSASTVGDIRQVFDHPTTEGRALLTSHSNAGASRYAAWYVDVKDKGSEVCEYLKCSLTTKKYSYNNPTVFKRLFWFSMDSSVFCAPNDNSVKLLLRPTAGPVPLTWEELEAYTWEEIGNFTWAAPGIRDLTTETSVPVPAIAGVVGFLRKLLRFPKAYLRFREIDFTITFTPPSNTTARLIRIYSLQSRVGTRAKTRFTAN